MQCVEGRRQRCLADNPAAARPRRWEARSWQFAPLLAASPSTPRRSFPILLEVTPKSYYRGVACLTQPTVPGPWTKYRCSACYGGACIDSECNIGVNRRRLQAPVDCTTGNPCWLTLEPNATSR